MRLTGQDVSKLTLNRLITLVPFSTSGAAPARRASQSLSLQLVGLTDFVSSDGVGGILAECLASTPCHTKTTLSIGRTVIATTGPELLGSHGVGYLIFSLTSGGKSMLEHARGHQLGAQVTISTGGRPPAGASRSGASAKAPPSGAADKSPTDRVACPPTAMPQLMIVIASTRPGRGGWPVAQWFIQRAADHGAFEVEVVDLVEFRLPLLDEPNHPRLRQYTNPHTHEWSAKVDGADAFVFVTPEYNHGYPASLKNAIDTCTTSGATSRSGSSPTAASRREPDRSSSCSRS